MKYIIAVKGYGMWEFKTEKQAKSFARALDKKGINAPWAIAKVRG